MTTQQGFDILDHAVIAFAGESQGDRLAERIVETMRRVTGAELGVYFKVNARQRQLEPVVAQTSQGASPAWPPLSLQETPHETAEGKKQPPARLPPAVHAAYLRHALIIDDLAREKRFDLGEFAQLGKEAAMRSLLVIPLVDQRHMVVGVVQLANPLRKNKVRPFSDKLLPLLRTLSRQAAVAITNRHRLTQLNQIGAALSAESDTNRLLERILNSAKELTNADAGTIYSLTPERTLRFEIVRTDSLGVAMGGTTGIPIRFPELRLYREDATPNLQMVAAFAVLQDQVINIPDAYEAQGFDFSGTKAFDAKTGYRSTSFLTVPLKNHEQDVIGVLQLINAQNPVTGKVRPFSPDDEHLVASLASQAAIAWTNQRLIANLKLLFDSFIRVISSAIDAKSPYTGGHCNRVPVLAEMIADAVNQAARDNPALAPLALSPGQVDELKTAAWLHDCGKVVTPVHVVDKSTKLETIHDRIHEVGVRIALLKRDAEITLLRESRSASGEEALAVLESRHRETLAQLDEAWTFLQRINNGGEFMAPEMQERVRDLARTWRWRDGDGVEHPLLSDDEVKNLIISRGTLTNEERDVINYHVSMSIRMLEALPFPKHLLQVPEIAGGHHEKMDGTGFPKGLKGEEMSVQARMLAIADIFEALTARDRPYKPGKPISESLKILGFMKKDGHIDPELFRVFVDQKVYDRYARAYLSPEQLDEVIPARIPGYA